jgi:hypothetical protein
MVETFPVAVQAEDHLRLRIPEELSQDVIKVGSAIEHFASYLVVWRAFWVVVWVISQQLLFVKHWVIEVNYEEDSIMILYATDFNILHQHCFGLQSLPFDGLQKLVLDVALG